MFARAIENVMAFGSVETHWWEWPLMILLSPLYLLVWIVILLLAIVLLVIGIFQAGWEKVANG